MTDRPQIFLCVDPDLLDGESRALFARHGIVREAGAGRHPDPEAVGLGDIVVVGEEAAASDPGSPARLREETGASLLLLRRDPEGIPEGLGVYDEVGLAGDLEDLDARLRLLLNFRSCWRRAGDLGLEPEDLRRELSLFDLDPGLVEPRGLSTPCRVSIQHLVDVEAVTRQQMSICRLMGTAYATFLYAPRPEGLPGPDGGVLSPTGVLSPYCAYLSSHGQGCLDSEFACSKRTFFDLKPVEGTCAGGIRLFSVPICLSFGGITYPLCATTVAVGEVPKREVVEKIARAFEVHPEILGQMGEESRFWILNPDKADEIQATIANLAETVSREVSHKFGTAFQLFRGLLTDREIRRSEKLLAESHRALEASNRKLKLKNEEIYEVTHAITHDLRKPLSGLKSAITMLRKGYLGELDEKQFVAVDTAHEATNYMQALVDDLLEAARLETGRKLMEVEEVELAPLLERIRKRLLYQLEEKGIDLVFRNLPETLVCDGAAIEKVLMNLIGNSVSYIGDGEKRITVSGETRGGMVRITVEDTGMGIPEDAIPLMFEKFQRGRNVAGIRGTGLGLAIVKGIVEAHGGKVEVESELGRGTRMTIAIPLREPVGEVLEPSRGGEGGDP